MTDKMDIDTALDVAITKAKETKTKSTKSQDIYSATIKTPPHAYAHLKLITTAATQVLVLDELMIRQFFTSALRQFLGLTGMGMPIDILKVTGQECWVRMARQDLGAFSSALTAWTGSGPVSGIRICAAGDWLGALVGRHDQRRIWGEL